MGLDGHSVDWAELLDCGLCGAALPSEMAEHGVGRTSSLSGRSVRDLPMLTGTAPSCLSTAVNAGCNLALGCGQRRRGCCFRRGARTSRTLGLSARLWEASRTMSPASSPEIAFVAPRRICPLRP
ncbi:unnamed protein product [Prunus armeniaca]